MSLLACLGLFAGMASAQATAPESIYTPVEPQNCHTLPPAADHTPETDGPEDYAAICPGPLGYTLRVEEGDLRPFVAIVRPDKTEHRLHLAPYSSGFSNLGPRAEWRIARAGPQQQPVALILRVIEVTDPNPQPPPTISRLVVSKITDRQICVVGAVPPDTQQNELARQMADGSAAMPCIRED